MSLSDLSSYAAKRDDVMNNFPVHAMAESVVQYCVLMAEERTEY